MMLVLKHLQYNDWKDKDSAATVNDDELQNLNKLGLILKANYQRVVLLPACLRRLDGSNYAKLEDPACLTDTNVLVMSLEARVVNYFGQAAAKQHETVFNLTGYNESMLTWHVVC